MLRRRNGDVVVKSALELTELDAAEDRDPREESQGAHEGNAGRRHAERCVVHRVLRRGAPDPSLFSSSIPLGDMRRGRSGRVAESYHLYRVTVRTDLPAALRAEIVSLPSARR